MVSDLKMRFFFFPQHDWCQSHFIHERHIKFAVEVRQQLLELCNK